MVLKVLVFDQLGCYAAVTAAAYLAGMIDKTPTTEDIYDLPFFAAHRDLQVGRIYYIGKDSSGNDYYSLGVGKEEQLIVTSVQELLNIIGRPGELNIIGVSLYNSFMIRLMAYLGFWFPLQKISKRISAYLLKSRFDDLANFLDALSGISHNRG